MIQSHAKEVPHSEESEMMVLGSMLTNIGSLNSAADILHETDFYYTKHQIIFGCLKEAHNKEKLIDVHLLSEELKAKKQLDAVGGPLYITTLVQYAGTSAYIEEYAEIVKNKSALRKLIFLGQLTQQRAIQEDADPLKLLIEAQEELKRIEQSKSPKEKFSIRFLDQFDHNMLLTTPSKKPMLLEYSGANGVPQGFLPKGIVGMLVGAGGVGKTHLLAQLAISVASGTPWLDTFTTTEHCGEGKKGSVFFGLGENLYDDIHRVLYKAAKKLRRHQPDILQEDPLVDTSKRIAAFSFCGQQAAFLETNRPSSYFRGFKLRLTELAPKNGWSLIILDPVSRLLGADAETDNAAATQFIALLEELTIELPGNPTILFAHHVNKSSLQGESKQNQSAARGSSALTDGVRWQCNFAKKDPPQTKDNDSSKKDSPDLVVLKMTKSNFTQLMPDITTEKDFDGFIKKHNASATGCFGN